MKKTTVICLMGPTATGKTALSLAIADHFRDHYRSDSLFEIISVDSAMVYRGMDIGSAKPTPLQRQQLPHHLINCRDPNNPYCVADFCYDASVTINDILSRQKIPLLVGGTMLYFKALQQGLSLLPKANGAIRANLIRQAKASSWQQLHKRLQMVDPDAAKRIHPNDPQRLQRALEVYEITGLPLTQLQKQSNRRANYSFVNIVLMPQQRFSLRHKIIKRWQQMLIQGLIDEVNALYARSDLHRDLPALRSVGYRQVWAHLSGKLSTTEMENQAITATCQLAKRQMTWLRNWPNAYYFDSFDDNLLQKLGDFIPTYLNY